MAGNSTAAASNSPAIHPGAFVRALLWPLIIWEAWVLLAAFGGYPGVVCLTPMAWLLALWSGAMYASQLARQPVKWPLAGAALVGAVLGAFLGGTFVVVGLGVTGEELSKAQMLSVVMLVISVPVCAALSTFNAWLIRRRMARSQ